MDKGQRLILWFWRTVVISVFIGSHAGLSYVVIRGSEGIVGMVVGLVIFNLFLLLFWLVAALGDSSPSGGSCDGGLN